jgi:tRNA threonylcarbamoyladenosine biosynthesis protein TsaB
MAASLYIDSSEHLVLGLLDENLNWIDFLDTKERKGSGILHGLLHELLENQNLSFKDLKQVFFTAGPGSYTGMRLGEGMCQVLEMENVKINSFYHFEVPFLLGDQKGVWISKAFKREIFVFQWDGSDSQTGLIPEEEMLQSIETWKKSGLNIYTHFSEILDQDLTSTSDMIHTQSDKLFCKVAGLDERKTPYYYRTDEKEFRVSEPSK